MAHTPLPSSIRSSFKSWWEGTASSRHTRARNADAELQLETLEPRYVAAADVASGNDVPLANAEPAPVVEPAPIAYAAATRIGSGALIQLYNGAGDMLSSFLLREKDFRKGVHVAVGDVNGDGSPDLVVGAGLGSKPQVKVFDGRTLLETGDPAQATVTQFFAFPNNHRGGADVAIGDVDGDGENEIVVGIGKGNKPTVRIFDGDTGVLEREFRAFEKKFGGGVEIAVADVDNDLVDDVIVARGGGKPEVRVFSGVSLALIRSFKAFPSKFHSGIHVAAGDVNGDGAADIIATTHASDSKNVRVFDGVTGALISQFQAFEKKGKGGIHVGAADIDGDGTSEILVGTGAGDKPRLRVFEFDGTLLDEALAYGQKKGVWLS